jgi:2-polyprenyl-3-methyl-5-hydroxy-6-metoxy-1,4-benzoquinol methylase
VYSASKINLGLLSEAGGGTTLGDQVTARTWQIPAAGGFMLLESTEELVRYFAPAATWPSFPVRAIWWRKSGITCNARRAARRLRLLDGAKDWRLTIPMSGPLRRFYRFIRNSVHAKRELQMIKQRVAAPYPLLPPVNPFGRVGVRNSPVFAMTDFRQPLYRHYVSKFKRSEAPEPPTSEKAARQYFDRKYFPHLRHLGADDAILDVGCGSGLVLTYLNERGFRNTQGVDISEEQVELAKAKRLQVWCGDIFSFLQSRADAFKAVIALDFLEHFTKAEVLSLFGLLFRTLKPDGSLLIQTPNGQGLFAGQVIYGDLTHCTVFTPESLSQALRLAGFDRIVFDETGPVPKDWKGRIKLMLWKSIKMSANFIRVVEAGKHQEIWTENLICVCRKPGQS